MSILWELYPDHPNLLPTFFDPSKLGKEYVQKPLLSREGADITIFKNDGEIKGVNQNYGSEGYIYQKYVPINKYNNMTPILGSWIVGGISCGLGIREDINDITGNNSHFCPHYFK